MPMTKYALMLAAAGFVAFAPAIVKAEEAVAPVAEEITVKEYTLEDGTKVVVEEDAVFVVAADGTKTAAPDGDHKASDGTSLTVKEGKLVH